MIRAARRPQTTVTRAAPMLLVLGFVAAACGTSQPTAAPSPPDSNTPHATPSPTPTPLATRTASPEPTPTPTPLPTPGEGMIGVVPVAEGLTAPLGIVNAGGGAPDLYVIEQGGTVRRISPPAEGAGAWLVEADPFFDVSDRVSTGGEQGLLGFAFHPAYETSRRVFAHYTDLAGDTVVAGYAAAPDGSGIDAAGEAVILRADQPYPNHNGGELAFGPDGFLYLALGDGGASGDPMGHGQDTETLLGSILRVDVDAGGDEPYAIPDDNPFVDGGGLPEIWAYGLRNPWRFSFDRASGDLYIADVGQARWEEVDRQPADSPGGENFGWDVMEGPDCYAISDCDTSGLTLPVTQYERAGGDCTIIGGYVYRGSEIPALTGTYVFGDYCSGRVRGWDTAAGGEPFLLVESGLRISSFGEDASGELYLTDIAAGSVQRLVPATPDPTG